MKGHVGINKKPSWINLFCALISAVRKYHLRLRLSRNEKYRTFALQLPECHDLILNARLMRLRLRAWSHLGANRRKLKVEKPKLGICGCKCPSYHLDYKYLKGLNELIKSLSLLITK